MNIRKLKGNIVYVHLTEPSATGIAFYSGRLVQAHKGWVELETNNGTDDDVTVFIKEESVSFIEMPHSVEPDQPVGPVFSNIIIPIDDDQDEEVFYG